MLRYINLLSELLTPGSSIPFAEMRQYSNETEYFIGLDKAFASLTHVPVQFLVVFDGPAVDGDCGIAIVSCLQFEL